MKTTTALQNVLADIATGVGDTDWMDDRACRDEDPELFFPLGESDAFADQIVEAKAVCVRCPVIEQCLRFGAAQSDGIFGGLTAGERRAMREAANRTAGRSEKDTGERFPAREYGYSTDEARQLFRELVDELQRAGKVAIRTRDFPKAFVAHVRSRSWVLLQLQHLAKVGALTRTAEPGVFVFCNYSTASAVAS
jgi:WhiB family transcriptional regulator, redox-sensing transcriptional regulator